jgi:hypothetical protein
MVIWGGNASGGTRFNTGGRYTPGTDSWIATSVVNAPAGRGGHTALWTGGEMIVWGGGVQYPESGNRGGRYCAQSGPTPSPTPTPTPCAGRCSPTPRPRPTPPPRP